MTNLSRNELIKALVKGLKLDDNIFNYQAVAEEIESIQENDFMDFYKLSMAENTYGNGLQAIMKIAERYKPQDQVDQVELKAKQLISACETMNTILCTEAHAKNMSFDDYILTHNFNNICDDTKAILNNVKPFGSYVLLIKCIRQYQDSQVAINAFKEAIRQHSGGQSVLGNGRKVTNLLK